MAASELTINGPDRVMELSDDATYRNTIARMFRSSFIEAFSKVHPIVPALLFVPVAGWFAWQGLATQGFLALAGILGGLFFWTITEYVLHRFLFHLRPMNTLFRILYVYLHGIHHHYPEDKYRLVMVPAISVPLAFLFFFLFSWALPAAWVSGVFAGMVLGYLAYDYTHWATHWMKPPQAAWLAPVTAIFKVQRKRHMRHHFADHTKGFGVSTGLWDRVFGTVDPAG